mgnify:CR=1 FL=1
MKERDTLKIDATKYNDEVLFKEYKRKRNDVKEKLRKDKEEYSNRILDKKGVSSKEMWKSVKDVLKLNKNLAPTKLKIDGEIVSSPETLVNAFNDIFIKKVKDFKDKTNVQPKIDPIIRLNSFLEKRQEPLQEFKLKPITIEEFKKHLKNMKGSRTHGLDFIDSFSLKLAAPTIENVLLHLTNLSLTSNNFALLIERILSRTLGMWFL